MTDSDLPEAFTENVVDALYDMEDGDTFAARIEEDGSSLGPRNEYFRVKSITDGYGRHLDRIMKIEMRREPSADYWLSNTIYETDNGDAEIRRLGPPTIHVHGVAEDPLAVDYSSDKTLKATCDECGNSGTVPVSEDDHPLMDPILTEDEDDERVTACCHSRSWTTSVEFGA